MIFTQHSLHMSCDRRKRKVGVRFPPPPPRISTPSKNKQKFFYLIFFFGLSVPHPLYSFTQLPERVLAKVRGSGAGEGRLRELNQ